MTPLNQVGGERSIRVVVMDSAERIMLEDGYAAVSYRNVAATATVSLGAVQHHFPTLDDLFIAVLRRYGERNLEKLVEALRANPDDTLGILWEYGGEEASAALLMEFIALANHRKRIHAEITEVVKQSRQVQLNALTENWERLDIPKEGLSPASVLVLIASLPKWMLIEASFGMTAGHAEICALVLHYVDKPRHAPCLD
jgi:AcrR family transcriptional regulator